MEAYCVKCKTKRELQDPRPLYTARGAALTRGTCPVCGTNLTRLGKTEMHAGVNREALIADAKSEAQKESVAEKKPKRTRPRATGQSESDAGIKKKTVRQTRSARTTKKSDSDNASPLPLDLSGKPLVIVES
ncbi:MAG TPA: DUF5679 domain-containing protein, partial [Anaerolineae bacterium]